MGPASDLGPVDPQFIMSNGSIAAARAIIAAVELAEQRIQQSPESYPLHASLLSDINALQVQQARDAIERTGDLVKEALACVESRQEADINKLANELEGPLVNSKDHRALFSASDAVKHGLPVKKADPSSAWWDSVWRLWMKYYVLDASFVYEGESASQIGPPD